MISPGLRPARCAGEPSMGATMTSWPFLHPDFGANAFKLSPGEAPLLFHHLRGKESAVPRIPEGIDHAANGSIGHACGFDRLPIDIDALNRIPSLCDEFKVRVRIRRNRGRGSIGRQEMTRNETARQKKNTESPGIVPMFHRPSCLIDSIPVPSRGKGMRLKAQP